MTVRFVRFVALLLLVGAGVVPVPTASEAATPGGVAHAPGPDGEDAVPAVPPGVERLVAGDMAVDWLDGAPHGEDPSVAAGMPSDLVLGPDHPRADGGADPDSGGTHEAVRADGQATDQHHAGASGGYALFSATARWLAGGYTIRLTGADGRVEQYRDELSDAARAASAATGMPVRVAPTSGGPVDPARGEIAVVVASGPCGPGSVGCGGPALTSRELVSGRVWIHPSALGLSPDRRANLAAHELGHALGLQHFDAAWTDGRQVMYPVLSGTTSFRAGDGAGLRRAAGVDDRPAGTVTSRTYAAGRAHVTGTVASGSRIRISAGLVTADVTVGGGRFSGSVPLPAGRHVVCATVLDPAPDFRPALGCGTVEAAGAPFGHLDGLHASVGSIEVRGWALDPQTAGPVQVQIRRNGALVATIDADEHRDDLGDHAHHYGTAHGFDAAIIPQPGRNHVCVQVVGVGAGGDAQAGCAEIEHAAPSVDRASLVPAEPSIPRVPLVPVPEVTAAAGAVVDQVVSGAVVAVAGPGTVAQGLPEVVGGR